MLICKNCKGTGWKIFETEKQSSNAIRLECLECGNEEPAFYNNGNIFMPKGNTADHSGHSFKPLKCTCRSNSWRISENEIAYTICRKKFYFKDEEKWGNKDINENKASKESNPILGFKEIKK